MYAADSTDAGPRRDLGPVFGRDLNLRLLGALSLLAVAVAALALLGFGPSLAGASFPTPQATQPPIRQSLSPIPEEPAAGTAQSGYSLALISFSATVQGDIVTVQGTVRNLTDKSLSGLLAIATLYGADRTPLRSMDALVEEDPLPPGGVSAFRITLKRDPEAPLFGVQFRQWHVGSIPAVDVPKS